MDALPPRLQSREMDRILGTLSDSHRRILLLLLKRGGVLTESDMMVRGSRDKEAVKHELIHTHLPMLEEAGYIEWDPETGTISEGPRFDEIAPLLELMENHSDELPADWP